MKLISTLAVSAAALLSSAIAQPNYDDPMAVMPHLGLSQIEPFIKAVDPNAEIIQFGPAKALRLEDGGNIVLLISNACNQTGECAGLVMLSLFQETPAAEKINAFNADTPVARAFIEPNSGNLNIFSYLIGDFGVTQGSLIMHIASFFGAVSKWQDEYSSNNLANTIAFEPLVEGAESLSFNQSHISQELLEEIWANETVVNRVGAAVADDTP